MFSPTMGAPVMKLSLVVNHGVHKGKVIPIPLKQFLIGRDPQCHLRPASPLISKRHCALLVQGDKILIRDFDSTNGTVLNDEPVKGERELKNDDRLLIGPLSFLVRVEAGAIAGKPAAAQVKPPLSESEDDESAAALLLEAGEGGETTTANPVDNEEIPSGSTIMDLPALEASEGKPGSGKTPPPKESAPDTSFAAKSILDKYRRRRT
jgi:pSer/pThr/pTyr-binding forkhead associated (FHA) protein